mmetsp:Transcript_54849/g.146415  ORF Transcript_54849/g.146415 Transcript_54849/m.146415 type:complete len:213 (+) Transcript_54849:2766-3404(+)
MYISRSRTFIANFRPVAISFTLNTFAKAPTPTNGSSHASKVSVSDAGSNWSIARRVEANHLCSSASSTVRRSSALRLRDLNRNSQQHTETFSGRRSSSAEQTSSISASTTPNLSLAALLGSAADDTSNDNVVASVSNGLPISACISAQPALQTSTAGESSARSKISGAVMLRVPKFAVRWQPSTHQPNSAIFSRPSPANSRFLSLMSLWMMH